MKPTYRINGAAFSTSVCAVLFGLFAFAYLYFYQADLIAVGLHLLSGGPLCYHNLLGALLLTTLLLCLQRVTASLSRLPQAWHAATYFPSALLLVALTSLSPVSRVGNVRLEGTFFLLPLLLVAYICGVALWRRKIATNTPKFSVADNALWTNLLLLAVTMLFVGLMGTGDDVFHYRMKTERLLLAGRNAEAQNVGQGSSSTDSSLSSLRIFTLSQAHLLGEKLFEYPLVGGSEALLPNGSSVCWLLLDEHRLGLHLSAHSLPSAPTALQRLERLASQSAICRAAADYLLCGYLLDRKLDAFAKAIPRFYRLSESLPRHYREALTLYMHLRSTPVVSYHDDVVDTDFRDFQDLENKFTNRTLQQTALHDVYGSTYWYYYTFPPISKK